MPRITVAIALTMQLFMCIAPADAVILCVSNDGCVELELARPGTQRCVETDCDDGHAGTTSHGCRDIPVLGAALATARASAGDHGGAAALLPASTTRLAAPAPLPAAPSAHALAPPPAPPRRTTILQI